MNQNTKGNYEMELTEAEISNLITDCKTSYMRKGSTSWQNALDEIAEKLAAYRSSKKN